MTTHHTSAIHPPAWPGGASRDVVRRDVVRRDVVRRDVVRRDVVRRDVGRHSLRPDTARMQAARPVDRSNRSTAASARHVGVHHAAGHGGAQISQLVHVRPIRRDRLDAALDLYTPEGSESRIDAATAQSQVRRQATTHANAADVRRGVRMLMRIVALLTIAVLAVTVLYAPGAEAESQARHTVLHVVQPGDSLWSLASRHTPAGDDVRITVDEIVSANGLETATLQVGARIEIPTRG